MRHRSAWQLEWTLLSTNRTLRHLLLCQRENFHISRTVLLCTIVLQVYFFFLLHLNLCCFAQKLCLITSLRCFRSNIILWVPNLQQTLKQKFCYLNKASLISKTTHSDFARPRNLIHSFHVTSYVIPAMLCNSVVAQTNNWGQLTLQIILKHI